jgi:hypothetical protein
MPLLNGLLSISQNKLAFVVKFFSSLCKVFQIISMFSRIVRIMILIFTIIKR